MSLFARHVKSPLCKGEGDQDISGIGVRISTYVLIAFSISLDLTLILKQRRKSQHNSTRPPRDELLSKVKSFTGPIHESISKSLCVTAGALLFSGIVQDFTLHQMLWEDFIILSFYLIMITTALTFGQFVQFHHAKVLPYIFLVTGIACQIFILFGTFGHHVMRDRNCEMTSHRAPPISDLEVNCLKGFSIMLLVCELWFLYLRVAAYIAKKPTDSTQSWKISMAIAVVQICVLGVSLGVLEKFLTKTDNYMMDQLRTGWTFGQVLAPAMLIAILVDAATVGARRLSIKRNPERFKMEFSICRTCTDDVVVRKDLESGGSGIGVYFESLGSTMLENPQNQQVVLRDKLIRDGFR